MLVVGVESFVTYSQILVCALSLLFAAVIPVIQFRPPRPPASITSVLWQDADPQNSC